jgi:hypothetical protein
MRASVNIGARLLGILGGALKDDVAKPVLDYRFVRRCNMPSSETVNMNTEDYKPVATFMRFATQQARKLMRRTSLEAAPPIDLR